MLDSISKRGRTIFNGRQENQPQSCESCIQDFANFQKQRRQNCCCQRSVANSGKNQEEEVSSNRYGTSTVSKRDHYLPALGWGFLTPLYDPLLALTKWDATFKKELRRQAKVQPGMCVLDLACGTGTLTVALQREQPDAEIHALDGDERILTTARQKAQVAGAQIRFTKAVSTAMPYGDEFFDLVVTSLFFHHLTRENKKKTLQEIFRVLKPGGRLLVADWGKPANFMMKMAQQLIIWLDGATTRDSFQGKLPEFMREAHFADVTETGKFNTFCGTVRLHRAEK